jgi:putative DNA primase/helicase
MSGADYKRITERLDAEIPTIDGILATRWTKEMVAAQAVNHLEDWPEPQPLAAKVEFEPYPLDSLPTLIRHAVLEVAGFVKAPEAMVAMSAIGALSLASQALADVKRAEKLQGPIGLFTLTIAKSGERKTTCDGFFTKAIREYEKQQAELAKPEIKNYKADMEAWESKRGGIKDRIRQFAKELKPTQTLEAALRDLEYEKPEPIRVPRLLRADITPEQLGYVLAKEWPSCGVVSAEAGLVFGSHGMGKDSVMRNLSLLNVLWDGGEFSSDRRSTESFTVSGARFSMALQIQEATLREFFSKSGTLARGNGFLARFLLAWPQSTQGMRPFTEAPTNWPNLGAFNQRIASLLAMPAPLNQVGVLAPPLMTLSPEAKKAWVEYHDAVEIELSANGEFYDIQDVASKSADNAVRLAALFSKFEGEGSVISAQAFKSASVIAAWHLQESQRFFGELALSSELSDAVQLEGWLVEYSKQVSSITIRIAQQRSPIRDKNRLKSALWELEDLDRLRIEQVDKSKIICINPGLL